MATVISARSGSVTQYLNPFHLVRNLWRHRDLIRQFTWRDIEGRYKGSFLGLFWSLVNPLVLLLIYTFVFGIVFKAHWPGPAGDGLAAFAVTAFCGIAAFTIFSECAGRAANLVINVPNYVKKVVFPLEILPVSTLGAALFHALISLGILLVANLFVSRTIPWTLVLLPLVVLPLICFTLGISWFLASLGVFVRDMGYTITLIIQVLFFTTPIFYALETIPEPFRSVVRLNPFTAVMENVRRVVLWGELPLWPDLVFSLVASLIVMVFGYAWFMKTKKAFADVI